MKIFIASLPFSISEEDVLTAFSTYGTVSSVKIISDKASGKSRGFGFVEMPDEIKAAKAIADLNGADVKGRVIVVRHADERDRSLIKPAILINPLQPEDQPVLFKKRPRKTI